jgi:prephenate dehydrogenase
MAEAGSLNVAVLGVGLIGGSIGMAARRRAGARVRGYDSDAEVLAEALALGAIDDTAGDVASAVRDADVVFVATPVGALAKTVRQALAGAGPGCVISDVGSTKRVLAGEAADERLIGGHPLAGAETSGVQHAREDLFEGAVWYLTPGAHSAGVLYERLHRLLSAIGARPTAIDADTHDRLLAAVSHLPHVLANLLVTQAACTLGGEQAEVGQHGRVPAVGPSFRDATRVAGANSAIWTDIYMSNRDALIAAIDAFAGSLSDVRTMLQAGDVDAVRAWNERARADRDELLGAGITGGTVGELRASVPNRPGVIAEIALALGGAGVNIVDMALSPSEDNRQGVVALWISGEQQVARAEQLIGELGFPVARA